MPSISGCIGQGKICGLSLAVGLLFLPTVASGVLGANLSRLGKLGAPAAQPCFCRADVMG